MSRPGSQPVWATATNFSGGPAVGTPAKVTPSGAKQIEGFDPAEEPGAQNMNWWMNLAYQWINWLAAGVLDGTWEFTSTVQMDARLTSLADVYCTTGYYGAAGGIALAPAGLSATVLKFTTAANRHIPWSLVSDNAGASSCTTHVRGRGSIILAASGTAVYAPIPIRDDETITAYLVGVQKNDTTAGVACKIVSNLDAGETNETAGSTSPNTVGVFAVAETGLALAGGKLYSIKITPSGGVTPAADRIIEIRYSFTRP